MDRVRISRHGHVPVKLCLQKQVAALQDCKVFFLFLLFFYWSMIPVQAWQAAGRQLASTGCLSIAQLWSWDLSFTSRQPWAFLMFGQGSKANSKNMHGIWELESELVHRHFIHFCTKHFKIYCHRKSSLVFL